MAKISQAIGTKIVGTSEHEKCKEKSRKRSQHLRTKIFGKPEHEKCKDEMRKKSQKHNKQNLTSQKTSKQNKFKMDLISYVCNRCLYRKSVLIFYENRDTYLF